MVSSVLPLIGSRGMHDNASQDHTMQAKHPQSTQMRGSSRSSTQHTTTSIQMQAELETHLTALFSSIAESHSSQQRSSGNTPSSSSATPPNSKGESSGSAKKTPSSSSSSSDPKLSSDQPPSTHHLDFVRTNAAEISHALLAALNPHSHISTSVRIRNIMIALIGSLIIAGGIAYLFRDKLKENISEQTADVASRSLGNAEVQSQVNVLTAEVLRKLLNDPVIMENCLGFLQTLFASPETKQSLITLLQGTLRDPETLVMVSGFASELLTDIMNRPETVEQLTLLLRKAITEPGNEQALQVLFKSFAVDAKTQEMIAELAKKAALDVMNDPQVKTTAVDFIKDVTSDTSLQQSTGDALWGAVKHAVRPSWFHGHAHVKTTKQIVDQSATGAPIEEVTTQVTFPSVAVVKDEPLTDSTLAITQPTTVTEEVVDLDDAQPPTVPK